MSLSGDQLFALLPAVYRTRDAEAGGPLQALFQVLASQSSIVEDNIRTLYDDQFIETCSSWAVPYIGDLIGFDTLHPLDGSSGARAAVANTIGYRRRKGTLIALEQVCADVSARPALAVEEFQRLITTLSLRHVNAGHVGTVDVRDAQALTTLGTPFDSQNHTIDVRRIAPRVRETAHPDPAPLDITLHGPGRFNLPEVAIHLWRWQQSWPVSGAPAFALGGGRYLFSPLGAEMPLFTNPSPRAPFASLTTAADIVRPIGRSELGDFYGSALSLTADGVVVTADTIVGANLADRPGGAWCVVPDGMIAIDPELGRIQFAADLTPPAALTVSYCYGFPAAIGGGPYDRSASLALLEPASLDYIAIVGDSGHPTLASAVEGWNATAPGSRGAIILPGFASLPAGLTGPDAIELTPGCSLSILAAAPDPTGGPHDFIYNSSKVTLSGDLAVNGVAPSGDETTQAGTLIISGVWIAGQLRVQGAAGNVQLADCTLVPGLGLQSAGEPLFPGEPSVVLDAPDSTLGLTRCVSGPIAADPTCSVRVCGSFVDASGFSRVAYAGPDTASAGADLHIEGSTVVGKVHTRTLNLASNTIFLSGTSRMDPWPAPVWASRRQSGCVRFCWLPADSITPRRYSCLPPEAGSQDALTPSFVTLRYGDPAYGLLSGDCPVAVWTGADNGSQIGAYLQIQETEAIANVALRAPEYLPAQIESGIFLHPSRPQLHRRGRSPLYGYGPTVTEAEPHLPGIGAELI